MNKGKGKQRKFLKNERLKWIKKKEILGRNETREKKIMQSKKKKRNKQRQIEERKTVNELRKWKTGGRKELLNNWREGNDC